MDVLIVSPCNILPVPGVKGGAVQTLIDTLLLQNEEHKKLNTVVFSVYDSHAKRKSLEFKSTKFFFIKKPKICQFFDNIISGTFSKKQTPVIWRLYTLFRLSLHLLFFRYDKIVFENSLFLLYVFKNPILYKQYKDKIFIHLHNDISKTYAKAVRSSQIFVISNYLSQGIIQLYGNDMQARIHLLRNAFNYKKYCKDLDTSESNSLKKLHGISAETKIILFVGRIIPEKGLRELIEAFKQINCYPCHLLIIGSSNFGNNAEIDSRNSFMEWFNNEVTVLDGSVTWLGYVPYDDIWKYYKCSDIAVLPSTWQEPSGLTMMEAMASSLPLLTTAVGGIPEYMDERYGKVLENNEDLVEGIVSGIEEIFADYTKFKKKAELASKHIAEIADETLYYERFVSLLKNN